MSAVAIVMSPEELDAFVEKKIAVALEAATLPKKESLTMNEVCTMLDVNRKTVARLVRDGMPSDLIGRRERRFNRTAVRAWLDARQGSNT